jgi:hypothetical protein
VTLGRPSVGGFGGDFFFFVADDFGVATGFFGPPFTDFFAEAGALRAGVFFFAIDSLPGILVTLFKNRWKPGYVRS